MTYDDASCFDPLDPEVDFVKVKRYLDWKRSRIRYPIYQYARKKHWGRWYLKYREPHSVDNRWLMTVWYRILEWVMTHTQCIHMREGLNRIELIRVGLDLEQHRARATRSREWNSYG